MSQSAPPIDALSGASHVSSNDPLSFLEKRRSVAMTMLGEPGPNREELRRMLTIAARVPDHGGLEPWRFIVIDGDGLGQVGGLLTSIFLAENTMLEPERREKFASSIARSFMHLPLVIIVVSRPDPAARIPVWEQELSAGAVCMNLLHAAGALGFAGSWLTGWTAYSEGARRMLGIATAEKIAGVVPIGTAIQTPTERKRPDIDQITTRWKAEHVNPAL